MARKRITKQPSARRAAAIPSKGPKPSVRSVAVKEVSKQPHTVATLARPPRIQRPKRIHSRRFPPHIGEGDERAFHSTSAAVADVAALAVSAGDELKIVMDTPLIGPGTTQTASNVGEPSAAISDNVVIFTGNWYTAISTDRGKTFRFLNPATAFKTLDPPGKSFCCDQIVHYIPQIDTFVWLLQYDSTTNVDNFQRLAFAKTADAAKNKWRIFDITTATLGVPGTFLDYPDLAVGAGALYMSTNIFPPDSPKVGSAIVRIPFKRMTGTITVDRFVTLDHSSLRLAQNCGTTAYFAGHENTSTLRVFSWDETKKQPTSTTVAVSRWIGGHGYHSRTPDGRRWLDRADSRITGATLAGDELWFAWGVNRGSNKRDKPFIQVARIETTNLTLSENLNIFDPDSATCYAALSTNAEGEVGITYFIGGGTRFPTLAVGILTPPRREAEVIAGQRGPLADGDGSHHWGDYLTIRPAMPTTKLFASTGYVMTGAGSGDGSNRDCTPHFVIFGRQKNI